MTARIELPTDPEFSATRRAIARVQYQDDAVSTEPPAGQLWERESERDASTELYARWMRLGDGRIKFFRTRAERVRSATWGLTSIDDE